MTVNFNFKKYFKYFILFLLVYILLHSFTNVKASVVSNSVINITDTNYLFKDVWNKGTIDEAIEENYNSYIDDMRLVVQERAISRTNSSDFAEFESNYYYAIVLSYNHNNDTDKTIYMNLYYRSKEAGDFHFNFNFWSSSGLDSSTTLIKGSFYPNVPSTQLSLYGVTIRADGSNYYTQSSGYQNNWEFHKGSSGSYYGSFSYSNGEFNLSLNSFLTKTSSAILTDFYIDTNISTKALYFDDLVFLNSGYYDFEYLSLFYNNNGNYTITDYSVGAILLDFFNITPPNIKDLGENSYGINVNTISNVFLDFANNSSTVIECPSQRPFVSDVCYIYDTDIPNFNSSNTNVNNSAIWYLGQNSTISLNSDRYYVLTFRIFTDYNLDIFTTIYHLTNDASDRPFNILGKYYQDNTLYKDYVIVFKPTHTGTANLSFFNIVFSSLSDLTDDYNVSFGIFKTIKISEYFTEPSQDDVDRELTNNSLSSISANMNSSYFTNFSVQDYGLSSIITYPLRFAENYENYTCSSLNLPIPHLSNFSLPCISSIMSTYVPTIWDIYRVIFNGFFIYRILISLFSLIKNAYSPDNDRIEVVDL